MNRKNIFCFTGASGTGKSTLIEYVKEAYPGVIVSELSARPYLPKDGSYDKTLNQQLILDDVH